MRTKRELFALVVTVLMALAVAAPASAADTSGTVTISGMITAQMSLAVGPTSITFPSVSLGNCNGAPQAIQVQVNSNTPWGLTVTAHSTGANPLPVSKLYWVEGKTAPTCGVGGSPLGRPFADGSNTWYASGSQPVTGTSGILRDMAFALKLDAYESGGQFNFQLVYQVTQ